jgi:hypothetical protein
VVVDLLELLLALKGRHGSGEDLVVHGLATASGSDQHQTVAHGDRVVELDDLVKEGLHRLKFILHTHILH